MCVRQVLVILELDGVMKRSFFKKLIVSTAIIACLCMPAHAAENSGDADPDLMWEVTHPISGDSPDYTDDGMWYKSAREAYAEYAMQNEESGIPPAGILGTINIDGVNFQADSSDNSTLLDTLSCGQEVTVLERKGDWCKVSCEGHTGYIKSAQISACGLPLDCMEGRIICSVGEIRQTPADDGALVANICKDTKVTLLSLENGWYSVSYGTTSGYVQADMVEADSSADASLFKVPETIEQSVTEQSAPEDDWGEQVITKAKEFLGVPYVYGGASPSGFDCSGFTMYIYRLMGEDIPHSASSQWSSVGTSIDRSDLQPGDLVFFRDPAYSNGKACSHVGIYIGNGDFIHAASGSDHQICISSLSESYYDRYYKGAKHI